MSSGLITRIFVENEHNNTYANIANNTEKLSELKDKKCNTDLQILDTTFVKEFELRLRITNLKQK